MASFATAESASSELTAVDGRRGAGEIRYSKVEFLNTEGTLQTVTRSGKGLLIRFHYRATEPIEHPAFGMRIYTELGTLVTETSTWLHGLDIPLVPAGDGYLDLEIGALNLMPGRYQISLALDSAVRNHLYDMLENAVRLDVEEAPVYNSSRRIDSRYGVMFLPQRWRLDGIGSAPALEVSPAANA
jgi:hypothetical protein